MPPTVQGRHVGALAILAGGTTATLIYLHPELLRVPGWIAYSACTAFVLAGLALIAQSHANSRAYRWLVVALVGSMLVPPLWAAIGANSQFCSAAILGIAFVPSALACRVLWGLVSLFIALVFFWAVRWAMASRNAR